MGKSFAMRNFFDAVWWWIRLAALLVVAVYLIALIAMNAGQKADLWYWFGRPEAPSSIISLVLVSFLSGGVVFTTGWAMFKAFLRYRRTRAERRERAEREARLELQRKASMLRTKPPPTPVVRKPPAAAASPRTPLLTGQGDEPEQEPEPLDPRDAETRSVTLGEVAPAPVAPPAPKVKPIAPTPRPILQATSPTPTPTTAPVSPTTLAAPMPVPAATRPVESTPRLAAVEVREDEPPTPLLDAAVAVDGKPKLPPASPPPAGG